jgi:hypothetical protein
MKFNLLKKQTSRREMLRGSATLVGSAFLAHLFPSTSLSHLRNEQSAPRLPRPTCWRVYARQVQRRSPQNANAC